MQASLLSVGVYKSNGAKVEVYSTFTNRTTTSSSSSFSLLSFFRLGHLLWQLVQPVKEAP